MDSQKNQQLKEFEKDRAKEIGVVSHFLKLGNLVINGEFGQGKTSLIEAAAKRNNKKINYIDLTKIDFRKKIDWEIFQQLSFFGQLSFLSSKFKTLFTKIYLPFLFIALPIFIATAIPLTLNGNIEPTVWTGVVALVVLPFLAYILILPVLIYKNYQKDPKTIVLVSELNFDVPANNPLPIIWQLREIYKHNTFVFESNGPLNSVVKAKFNCREISLGQGAGFQRPLSLMIEELGSLTAKDANMQRIFAEQKTFLKYSNNEILFILQHFTYREVKDLNDDYVYAFNYVKGEINYLDFLIVKLFKKYSPDFLKFIVEDLKNFKESSEYKPNVNGQKLVTEELKLFLKEKSVPPFVMDILEKTWLNNNKENFIGAQRPFSILNPKYTNRYLGNLNFSFLNADLIRNFTNDAFSFVKAAVAGETDILKMNFKLYSDEECILFIRNVNKLTNEQMDAITNESNFTLQTLSLIVYLILESRTNKKAFMQKLSITEKVIFAPNYFWRELFTNDNEAEKEVVEVLGQKFYNKVLPEIKNINFPLQSEIMFKNEKNPKVDLFEINDYYKKLLEANKKFLLLNYLVHERNVKTESGTGGQTQRFYAIDINTFDLDTQERLLQFIKSNNEDSLNIYSIGVDENGKSKYLFLDGDNTKPVPEFY